MWTKENRPKYNRRLDAYPSDLTDAEWALIAPVIPPAKRGGAKRTVDVREIVNGIMYVLGSGCQWRAIPKDLPPRSTVYDYFDLWGWDGTLDRIHDALYLACREKAEREASPTVAIIDSQSVKSAEKGGPKLTRMAMMRARRSKATSGMSLSILKDFRSARWSTRLEYKTAMAACCRCSFYTGGIRSWKSCSRTAATRGRSSPKG